MQREGQSWDFRVLHRRQVGCKRMWLVLEKGNDDEVARFEEGRGRTAGQDQDGGQRRERMRSRSR